MYWGLSIVIVVVNRVLAQSEMLAVLGNHVCGTRSVLSAEVLLNRRFQGLLGCRRREHPGGNDPGPWSSRE